MINNTLLLIILIVALFIIFRNPIKEKFNNLDIGYNDEDPDTIAKLKETNIEEPTFTSTIEVAYNDIGAQRRNDGRIRPFNESNILLSNAVAESSTFNADIFGNSYYQLWESDQKREAKTVRDRANEIMKTGVNCLDYKNVNQCMSVCDDMDTCNGFYIDSPGKCCMMVDPSYVENRNRYNKLPNNIDVYAQKTVNELIKHDNIRNKGKVIFDYVKDDKGNGAYRVDMDRSQCKSLCPKCIMGRCPKNYRCTNMTADPRYNQSCIITNEDNYDESIGKTFDGPNIPYLDEKYGLDQYAGYDMDIEEPVLSYPKDYDFDLDAGIVPTPNRLDRIYKKYDDYHIGPFTYGVDYDIDEREEEMYLTKSIDNFSAKKDSESMDVIATRGGNNFTAIDAYKSHQRPSKYTQNNVVAKDIIPNMK